MSRNHAALCWFRWNRHANRNTLVSTASSDGFSPNSTDARILTDSASMKFTMFSREDADDHSLMRTGWMREKALRASSMAPKSGFVRCSWASRRAKMEDRLRMGRVG